jgi:pilus assembly protein CpaC
MKYRNITRRARLGTAMAALAIALGTVSAVAPTTAQAAASRPSENLNLSAGTGTLVRLPEAMTDVFVANDSVADVQVRSTRQLYIFGKGRGETTIYATTKSGRVVYAATVRVGSNIGSIGEMLQLAMPEAQLQATPMNNMLLLTGTVSDPDDVAEAQRLVQAYVGEGTQVISRVRSATPLQVNLKVRVAEVNRSALKEFGINLLGGRQTADGFTWHNFGVGQGDGIDPKTGDVTRGLLGTTFALKSTLFGLDIISRLNLAETDGFVTTLAEPNLTALSGETATFLAGGEFPIPVPGSNGAVTIEYKQYGVGLAFTPYVLADGRISMRVRPEVSELSTQGAVKLGDFSVPGLTTRRAETTVELGSGQSFMIGGLLRNTSSNDISKAPFLGDIPILGTLFRSTGYRRQETELVIIVTPYLVKPVSHQLAVPSDGYRAPNDFQRNFLGQTYGGVNGDRSPSAIPAPGPVAAPAAGAAAGTAAPGFKL